MANNNEGYAIESLELILASQVRAHALWQSHKVEYLHMVDEANEKLFEVAGNIEEVEAALKGLRDRATQAAALQRAIDSRG